MRHDPHDRVERTRCVGGKVDSIAEAVERFCAGVVHFDDGEDFTAEELGLSPNPHPCPPSAVIITHVDRERGEITVEAERG